MSTSHRSRCVPGSSSPQRTTSHMTTAIDRSDRVYTFSLTVDWFHTVHDVALTRIPANAAAYRVHRCGTIPLSQRSATRNHRPAEAALVTAAKRLIRTAYEAASGIRPNTWARMTKRGLPGGCGMPSTLAAAMYSEVSQNAVVGARVAR